MTHFVPWDKLQLKDFYDGGHRAVMYEIIYPLYLGYIETRPRDWVLMSTPNAAIFYGDREDVYKENIRSIARKSAKLNSSTTTHYYDFSRKFDTFEDLEYGDAFVYHPYDDTFKSFVEEIEKKVRATQEYANKNGPNSLNNKKAHTLILHLSQEQSVELKTDKILEKRFIALLESFLERFFFMVTCEDPSMIPSSILKKIDWLSYLGSKNTSFAHAFHTNEQGVYNVFQEVVGVVWDSVSERLYSVHSLNYRPSDYQKQRKSIIQAEEEAYAIFLSSLNDGSST